MGKGDIDWSILRGSVVLLVVSVVVGVAILSGSYYFWGAMSKEFDRQHRQLQGVRRKYHTVDEEERIIETFLPRYQALEQEGIIGREYRLDWIEKLRDASKALKLPSLVYDIETQEAFEPTIPVQDGKFKVFVSRMNLQLGLLHEEDLLRLLQNLDKNVAGLYSVSRCSVSRTRLEFQKSPTEQNLTANCTLNWFTVKEGES